MNEMEVEEESRPILTQKGMTNVSLSIRFIMSHFDLSYYCTYKLLKKSLKISMFLFNFFIF